MQRLSLSLTAVSLFLFCLLSAPLKASSSLEGVWERSDKQRKILIKVANGSLSGYLFSLPKGHALLDLKNPNKRLKKRRVIGLRVFSGFKQNSQGEWVNGLIYEHTKGKTYSGKIWIKGDTLHIKGLSGMPLFRQTSQWHRSQ